MRSTRLTCFGPLEHFDVLDDSSCVCRVCVTWRSSREQFIQISKERPVHRQTCDCKACAPWRKVRIGFRGVNAWRDLWIESSYHAARHKYGPTFMEWIAGEMDDPKRSKGWWAIEAPRMPMGYWFDQFESAVRTGVVVVTGAVSGLFSFTCNYLDEEIVGGGLASRSSLDLFELASSEEIITSQQQRRGNSLLGTTRNGDHLKRDSDLTEY